MSPAPDGDATHVSDVAEHDAPTMLGVPPSGARPYSSYVSAYEQNPQQAQPPYPMAADPYTQTQTQPPRSNSTKVIVGLIAASSLAVAGMLGYLFVNRGDDGGTQATTPISAQPTSRTSSPTSASSSSSPSSSSSGDGVVPSTQTVTETESANSGSSSGSSSGGGSLDGVIDQAGAYTLTRQGTHLTIYDGDTESANTVGAIDLPGPPADEPGSIRMLTLPGCSHPTVVFNAKGQGSGAYGYSSGHYLAYKSVSSDEMKPLLGNAVSVGTHGVNVTSDGGGVEYRESGSVSRGHGNVFRGCSSSDPDTLKFAGKND